MLDDINNNVKVEETVKLSPIFVTRIINIQLFSQLLEKIAIGNYENKIINNVQGNIQSKSSIAYVNIVKELNNRNTEFHLYIRSIYDILYIRSKKRILELSLNAFILHRM